MQTNLLLNSHHVLIGIQLERRPGIVVLAVNFQRKTCVFLTVFKIFKLQCVFSPAVFEEDGEI